MRAQILFGKHTLADAIEAIRPSEPIVINEARGFIAAVIDAGTAERLRAEGFIVRDDARFELDPIP